MASAEELLASYKAQKGGKGSGVAIPTGGEKKKESKSVVEILRSGLSDSNVGSFIEGAAKGATFGTNDEMKAALYSMFSDKTYGEELEGVRAQDKARAEEYTAANVTGQLGGSLLTAAATPVAGATTLMGALGKGAAGGALSGAAQGAGEGEGFEDRTKAAVDGALWGGAFGATFAAGGRAVKSIWTKSKKPLDRWTVDDFKNDKNAAYQKWRETDEVVDATAQKGIYQQAKAAVRGDPGYNPNATVNAEVEAELKKLKKLFDPKPKVMPDGSVVQKTPKDLHPMQLDQHLQDAWAVYKRTNNPKALDLVNSINDAINALPMSSELSKGAKAANSRYMQAKTLEHAMETAELTDAAGKTFNTGQRKINAITAIVKDPKKARTFAPEQIESMKKIIDGSITDKALRILGKSAPTGNGLLQNIMILGAFTNPLIGVAAVGTSLAREASNLKIGGQMQNLMSSVDPNYVPAPMVSTPSAMSRAIGKEAAVAAPPIVGDEQVENTDAQNMMDQIIMQRLAR